MCSDASGAALVPHGKNMEGGVGVQGCKTDAKGGEGEGSQWQEKEEVAEKDSGSEAKEDLRREKLKSGKAMWR